MQKDKKQGKEDTGFLEGRGCDILLNRVFSVVLIEKVRFE